MNPRIVHSRASREDLAEIWRFIANDSVFRADKFVQMLDERLMHLATNPLIGRPRPELATNIRSYPVSPLIVFYIAAEDGIQIVRILHSSRDIKSAMFGV
jgi:toxin ParE1/3/4